MAISDRRIVEEMSCFFPSCKRLFSTFLLGPLIEPGCGHEEDEVYHGESREGKDISLRSI